IRVCVPRVPHPPRSTLFPYTTLFRSALDLEAEVALLEEHRRPVTAEERVAEPGLQTVPARRESARHVPHVLVVHQEEGAEVVGLHPLARPLEPILPEAVPVDALLPVHAHGAEVRHVFPPLTGSG